MSEEILGIFPAWVLEGYRKLFARGWTCKLTFTTDRLIVEEEKRSGGIYFLHDPYYMFSRASTRDRLKMKEVAAESILKADAKKFELPYADIAVVELSSSPFPGSGSLRVFMGDLDVPKHEFELSFSREYLPDFKEILERALPGKV